MVGSVTDIPAQVLRENALRKAPKTMGQTQGSASDAASAAVGQAAALVPAQPVTQSTLVNELPFNGNITLAANPKRNYLLIQNLGGATMFLSTIKTGTLTSGLQIAPASTFEPSVCPVNQISITGTGFLLEGISV